MYFVARERASEKKFTMSAPVGIGIADHSSVAWPETATANQAKAAKHTDVCMVTEVSSWENATRMR